MTQDPALARREQELTEAMDWLMRLEAEPESRALREEHSHWLARSAAHQDAWHHACHTWRLLRTLPPAAEPAAAPAVPSGRRGWLRPVAGIAAAVAVACLMLLVGPDLAVRLRSDHMTSAGITQSVTLPDGSRIQLGAASAIATDFTGPTRRVRLLRGEAFFDVVPDTSRPFRVQTEGLEVTVVGTSFNVEIGKRSETVGVASGKVRVERHAGHNPVINRELLPGEQLSVDNDGSVQLNRLAIEDVGAWRENRLFVQNATIADVVASLQRYHSGRILLASPTLSAKRITGAFSLASPDEALESVIAPYQGKVHHVSPLLRVVTD